MSTSRRGSRARGLRLAAAAAAIAVVAGSAGAVTATALGNRTPATDAIAAVKGAGVMNDISGTFQPDREVTRKGLAVALHRGLPRLAVQRELGDLATAASAFNMGSLSLKVTGATGKAQGVLISVQLQLDHDADLSASCTPTFELMRGAVFLDGWSVEFYDTGFGEEAGVSFSTVTSQATNTTATYSLVGTNPCGQYLYTDRDVMTAQVVALNGAGTAFTPTVSRPANRPEARREH